MAQVASIEERIARSKRASAVERAWDVAKALEGDRAQIEGLQWIEPVRIENKGIARRIDFKKEFPEGVTYVTPVPMNLTVVAPGSQIVHEADLDVAWTMPLLTRMTQYECALDRRVQEEMGFSQSPMIRNRIDAISFLPFPKADASAEEQFTPEFMIHVEIDADLGEPDNYFAIVAKYGNKVIKQMVTDNYPKFVRVYADSATRTHFNAQMLVNLDAATLASTPDNAGELELYLHRITKGGFNLRKDIDLGSLIHFSEYGDSRTLSLSDSLKGGGAYRGLHALPSIPKVPVVSSAQAQKEVGDVALGEGIRGERVSYTPLEGYVADVPYGVQPIRIKFLGVREASQDAALQALHGLAQRY